MDPTHLSILCLAATLVNFPFGYYRVGVRKYSSRWFLAVHLPIPLLLVMRLELAVSMRAVPLIFTAAVLGQLAGGQIRKKWASS
ncbi:MAG: hypothetical protein IBX61_08670 [Thermoleophilia bacterium]|nr:hypothetical protein [Thermoleophilia bacterium]